MIDTKTEKDLELLIEKLSITTTENDLEVTGKNEDDTKEHLAMGKSDFL